MMNSMISITGGGPEVKVIRPFVEDFNKHLSLMMEGKNYGAGVNSCCFLFFCVFDDEKENSNWGMPKNKLVRKKDYFTKEWDREITFVLLFSPQQISKLTFLEFKELVCISILERLNNPEMKILKAFKFEPFKLDLVKFITLYRENKII